MWSRLLIRWVVTALAVAASAWLVPGISVTGSNGVLTVVVVAAVLGLVNAFIRPILKFLSCGLIVLTLGLFTLVVNAATFMIAANLSRSLFNTGFAVDGFWPAFWGAVVVSVVSFLLSVFVPDPDDQRPRRS
jgi:putative membrane protein